MNFGKTDKNKKDANPVLDLRFYTKANIDIGIKLQANQVNSNYDVIFAWFKMQYAFLNTHNKHIHTYTRAHIHIQIHVYTKNSLTYTYTYTHVHTYTHTSLYTYTHKHM